MYIEAVVSVMLELESDFLHTQSLFTMNKKLSISVLINIVVLNYMQTIKKTF